MKISRVVWMMILTPFVGLSIAAVVAAQGRPETSGPPVKDVTATAPLVSSGGSTPNISLPNGAIGSSQINSTQVQRRVTGNCAAGSSVAAINQDGTVACQTAGVTAVSVSAPLVSSGGSAPNISLRGVIISTNNSGVGNGALTSNTTGNDNTASGVGALQNNTTGAFNTASGGYALFSNTTGFGNTASGDQALSSDTTGNDNTASGVDALGSNTIGNANTASGAAALGNNTTGFDNTASGFATLLGNTTGNFNTAVGYFANVSTDGLTNATVIGANAIVNASNKVRLGDTNVNVIEGQVAYTFTSDATKKENFRPVDGEEVLRKIGGFNPTSWNYIGHDPKDFRHYGPMAQEFFAAFGHDDVGTSGTPTTINSGDMAGILMVAVQALEKRTAEQRESLEILKAENATLKALLEALAKQQ